MDYWNGKRVMITGGGGFLGSHVIEKLGETEAEEIFSVRSRDFDLTKEDQVISLFDEHPADIVIHLAGLVGGIGSNKAFPADYYYQNLLMGIFTLHYAWKTGAQKVIAAGAGCGYPEHAPMPLKEESFWEGYPQQESAPYSLAKRMLHTQSVAYWQQYNFPIVVTIPGNIYGPYDNFDLEHAHVIPALVRKFVEAVDDGYDQITVWGTGKPTRDFIYAGDAADGILKAAEVFDKPVLLNLSAGEDISIAKVVKTLVDLTGFTGKIVWDTSRPDGQMRRVFDMGKAKKHLNFKASTDLEEGLKSTIDWYRMHRSEARNVAVLSDL